MVYLIFHIYNHMNYLRVNSIDEYQSELMGYNIIGNKIVYLTEYDLCVLRVGGKFKKETAKIKGSNIINFVISRRGYLALLYKNRTIEIRRMDNLNEIVHKFNNVALFSDGSYPKMKWDYDELYLVYPENLEILDMKTKGRRGYTDIVVDYENEKMMDMVIANIMETERAVILHLANRLIFTIIPIPVTELQIPLINSVLNLYSSLEENDSRREFIAVLSGGNILKIINLLNLKQICEIDLQPKANQFLQMQSDPNHQCILIRYVASSTLQITKNVIYKINSQYYYCQNYNFYGQREPFFIYKFQIPINENLTFFPTTVQMVNDQIFDYYHLVFFKKGHVYSVFQFIPHNYSQTPTQLKYKKRPQWKQVEEWRDIIATFIQISGPQIPKEQRMLSFAEQQRQLQQYNIIKHDFDQIIAKFTAKINQQSKLRSLNQETIQKQWDQYMARIAKQRNFMIQTMQLFKIQPQVIKKNNLQKQQAKLNSQKQQKQNQERQSKHLAVSKQLESCIRQIEGRQERIDAKIKQKKKEIEVQKKQKTQVTKEQIQKYQQDYEKFVAEFMQQNQRKQKEQQQKIAKKQHLLTEASLQQKLILAMPSLNQEQRRMINNFTCDNLSLSANNRSLSLENDVHSHLQSENTINPHRQEWIKMQQILKNIQLKITPLVERFDPLLDRLKNIEVESLNRIKINENIIKAKCTLNIQQMVKNCCKHMMSGLNTKIKKQIDATTRQIYRLQDKNKTYYEESIQKFKQFIQYQIQNRIDIYYKSRRRLESKIAQISNEFSEEMKESFEKV